MYTLGDDATSLTNCLCGGGAVSSGQQSKSAASPAKVRTTPALSQLN